jgi:thymidylate kinase
MSKKKLSTIVSFMGVDGSGKTTFSKNLKKLFKNSAYLHLKPYIIFPDRRTVNKNPHKQKKSSSIISLFRLISWLISYTIFFLFKKNKKIYIFDRYAHDILIDPLRYRHNLSNKLTKFILNIFPEPDLWIFLKPSLKTVRLRKQELSENETKKQIKKYSIFFIKKKNVLKLDTAKNFKTLLTTIKKKISYTNI